MLNTVRVTQVNRLAMASRSIKSIEYVEKLNFESLIDNYYLHNNLHITHASKILNYYINDRKYTLLIKDNLSIKDKCFGFVLVPKCPLFRGATVTVILCITCNGQV